ncbi:hypothetical protein QVG61_05625 [Thiohalobacter sp. IOR34]|uniref:hypothetical protein n=1 Tax=Thiohalobacter sp. IOR34 TaxID=3057176 RepID=UPI0025AFDE78|nr:hypothetical protein [Thiohalobacter sp. IOR34]WJW76569.1 hypothetical protein QVG61_05625 [Thiohalobacter sp. IOR34]
MSKRQSVDIEDKVAFLSRPAAYPDHPHRVEVVETHMSWVFLTEHRVYKLKKPVRYDFLDFSTLERRHHDCQEELRLNRRLASRVYLGLVALTLEADGRLALDGDGRTIDWLVKMVRLPRERMLDQLIERGALKEAEIRRVGEVLADFYRRAKPVDMSGADYRRRFLAAIHDNQQALATAACELPAGQVEAVGQTLLGFLDRQAPLIEARADAGRIIEAHGDLRPEHVCLIEPPVFIDCLEFKRDFRLLDPADELAFLSMECEAAGALWIGPLLFDSYASRCADRPPTALIAFYKSHRALLRAKLSAAHLQDHPPRGSSGKWARKTRAYLQLASSHIELLD